MQCKEKIEFKYLFSRISEQVSRLLSRVRLCCTVAVGCEVSAWGGMVDIKINLLHESHQFRTHGCVISVSWEGNKQYFVCSCCFFLRKNIDIKYFCSIKRIHEASLKSIFQHQFQNMNRKWVRLFKSTSWLNFSNVSSLLFVVCKISTVFLLTFCTKYKKL